jgi:hypothetical protein
MTKSSIYSSATLDASARAQKVIFALDSDDEEEKGKKGVEMTKMTEIK